MDAIPEIDEIFTPEVSAEQRLWLSVIIVYVRDIQNSINRLKRASNGRARKIIGRLERDYNTIDHEWLESVCQMANIDYDVLRRHVKETIKPYINSNS